MGMGEAGGEDNPIIKINLDETTILSEKEFTTLPNGPLTPDINVSNELNPKVVTLEICKTPYSEMRLDKNGKIKTPEEKLLDFAWNCPAFSLTADDLYVLSGVKEGKEILKRMQEEKDRLTEISAIRQEYNKVSQEKREDILCKIKEIREDLNNFEKEAKISISDESTEERATINTISQLEID